ncbi:hypothetical protein BX616_006971, partial [Lobosporangium transversale]
MPALSASDVCQELDSLVLQYMDLIDEHLTALNRLSEKLQQGHEHISQAKYIMGPRNVSADCYDLRMKAIRGVKVKGSTDIELQDLWAEQQQAAKQAEEAGDEALRGEQQANEVEIKATIPDLIGFQTRDVPSGLRRRGGAAIVPSSSGSASINDDDNNTLVDDDKYVKSKIIDTGDKSVTSSSVETLDDTVINGPAVASTTTEDTEALKKKKKKKERNPNPLLWFGALAPMPLRNAQSAFQKEETIKALQLSKESHLAKTRQLEKSRQPGQPGQPEQPEQLKQPEQQ